MDALGTLVVALASLNAGQADWPGFRGAGASVAHAKNLPLKWSATENVAWKIALPGYGQSSPVVWGDKVFVTAVSGDERDKGFVVALDAHTGKKLWTHEFTPHQKAPWSNTISKAAPTPLVDAAAVYAFFEGGDLLALTHDGKRLWSRSLFKEYGPFENGHGLGSSPAQTADAVIVLVDHKGPSYLLALDKKTGKNRWKTDRPSRSSWTSPIVADGGKRIVVSSNGSVAAYDAATGKLLWEKTGLTGNTVASAVVSGAFVLIGAGEGRMAAAGKTPSNLCLKQVAKEPGFELLWEADKARASFASPLIHLGHAYFVSQQGTVYCVDLATGKQRYAERIEEACWASPLAAGDRIYFFGKNGRTTVIKSGPSFEVLAVNQLWQGSTKKSDAGGYAQGTTLYGVAAVDGAFFVRTGPHLYRIGSQTVQP